jgi:cytochrome oxidase Cu insertion factor (SCO1/SenC/PrrC family)
MNFSNEIHIARRGILLFSSRKLWDHISTSSTEQTTDMKISALLLTLIVSICASAQDTSATAAVPQIAPAQLSVPDIELVNQAGKPVHFNSDVVKNRLAVVSGFFTTCTAFCPITQESLSHLEHALNKRMGRDVVFILVSVDPANDTPEHMKAWAEKFHLGANWTLLSGNPDEVAKVMKALGLYVDRPQRHQSAMMIGNEKTGWQRVSSWSSTDKLVKIIDGLSIVHQASR